MSQVQFKPKKTSRGTRRQIKRHSKIHAPKNNQSNKGTNYRSWLQSGTRFWTRGPFGLKFSVLNGGSAIRGTNVPRYKCGRSRANCGPTQRSSAPTVEHGEVKIETEERKKKRRIIMFSCGPTNGLARRVLSIVWARKVNCA